MTGPEMSILLIDDDAMLLSAGQVLLHRLGYRVTTAMDGLEGLEALQEQGPFDVVILDLTMPGMSGRDTLIEIRRLLPDQKVIFCSGYATLTEEISADGEIQPDGCLAKPFSIAELSTILGQVLSPSNSSS